jgi:Zn-dependent protease with chaperone function
MNSQAEGAAMPRQNLIRAGAAAALLILAQPVLAAGPDQCLAAQSRIQEARALDQDQLAKVRPATGAVPAEVQAVFARLVRAAKLPAGVRLRLEAVEGHRNAWVDHSGTIRLAAGLWSGERALGSEEIAAVLAHEIAHAETFDPLARLCDTVALVGNDQLSFRAATRAMLQAIWAGDRLLAIRMMQQNHQRELRADQRGAQLLAAAGFAPEAMARMLIQVSGVQGGDSASHPALERRLEALGHAPH